MGLHLVKSDAERQTGPGNVSRLCRWVAEGYSIYHAITRRRMSPPEARAEAMELHQQVLSARDHSQAQHDMLELIDMLTAIREAEGRGDPLPPAAIARAAA